MASRNELVVRAESLGLDHEELTNDSVLEQVVLAAEALNATSEAVGGDRLAKRVKNTDGSKSWVIASNQEDLDVQVEASRKDGLPEYVDINRPAQRRDAQGHFVKE